MKTLAIAALTLTSVLAAPLARQQEVLDAYAKARVAARLRFVPGIFSIRAPHFTAYNPRGEKIDLAAERARYAAFFDDALRVRLTHACSNFTSEPGGLRCQAEHLLVVEKLDPTRKEIYTLRARMRSQDHWVPTPTGWKLQSSDIQSQSLARSGRMESEMADQDILGRPLHSKR